MVGDGPLQIGQSLIGHDQRIGTAIHGLQLVGQPRYLKFLVESYTFHQCRSVLFEEPVAFFASGLPHD